MTKQCVVRVDEETLMWLECRAKELDRTVSWVIRDAVRRVMPVVVEDQSLSAEEIALVQRVAKGEATAMLVRAGVSPERCPGCGCSEVMHRAGAQQNKCERHVTCRWTP